MKITAKEIQTGMTVKDGYLTIEVSNIEKGTLKNGKITYTVSGKGTHKHTGSKRVDNHNNLSLTFKENTKVKVI